MEPTRSTAQLASQLRIIFCELKDEHEAGGGLSPQQAVRFARRYVAEMYQCAEELRNEAEAAKASGLEDEHELRAEMQRTLWSVCIWELSVLMFIRRPLVMGEALVPWWQARSLLLRPPVTGRQRPVCREPCVLRAARTAEV